MFKRLRSQFLRILPTIIILSSFVHGAYDPNDPRHQLVNKIKEQYATEITARQALLGTHYNVVALVDIARERLELERFTPSDPNWGLVIRYALSGYGYSKGVDATLRTSDAEISSLKVGHALSSAYLRAQRGVDLVEFSQMHAVMAASAMASLVDVTACVTDAVPVPSTLLSSAEEYADILNRVAASIPEEVHAFAETAVDRLRGLSQLNKFNAWFAHERFWAAGGVIDPHTYEQQRTSRAAFAGTPIAFLNDLSTKLDTAMRSMDAVPTPQSVEDLVRQSQQILLTIAAGTIGEDGIPIRLNPANAADWQIIRKALFLALSVTEDPEKSGKSYLTPVYELANYYYQKTDTDAVKEYYLKLEAYGVGFSTFWKGLKEAQTNAVIQTKLAELRDAVSDPLYGFIRGNPTHKVQRNVIDPLYKGAFVSSINAISVVDSRAELATALGLHGRLNHTQVFKTLYPDLTMWAEYHVPSARAEELMGSARPRIVVPAGFQPKRIHLAYVAGKWSLKGINGAREHILWTQGSSATQEFIGSLEDARGTHLFNFKVEGATAVIRAISSGYGFNAENAGTNIVVAHGDELGLIESSSYPEDTDVENFADGSIIIRGNTYSGMRGFLSALRSSALITAPKIDLNYAKGYEVRTHSNGATFNFLVKKGQGIGAHNSVILNGDSVALNQSSIRGRFTVQMYKQTDSNNYLRTDGTDIQTAYFFLEHNCWHTDTGVTFAGSKRDPYGPKTQVSSAELNQLKAAITVLSYQPCFDVSRVMAFNVGDVFTLEDAEYNALLSGPHIWGLYLLKVNTKPPLDLYITYYTEVQSDEYDSGCGFGGFGNYGGGGGFGQMPSASTWVPPSSSFHQTTMAKQAAFIQKTGGGGRGAVSSGGGLSLVGANIGVSNRGGNTSIVGDMTFGSAMQNMNLGETTLGFDYRSGEGGKSLGLSSTFTPPTLMESVQLGAMGINPAAPSAALGLHMGASAGILQLTAHQGKMNAANVFKAIRGVRSAVAVGTPSTTSGRISFSDAIIQSFKEAHGIDEEANAKATGEDEGKSVAATGGPKGQLPDPDKDGKETKVEQGKSQAPEVAEPDSIYEQLDDKGTSVKSRTFYDKNGRQFSRQDFAGKGHPVPGSGGERVLPHEHQTVFDAQGLPIAKEVVKRVAEGYTNAPTL